MSKRTFYTELHALGGEEYGFHDFRRTVGSSLDANGVPERLIEDILGHGKKTVFQKHYRAVADERLHRAILALYRDDPL